MTIQRLLRWWISLLKARVIQPQTLLKQFPEPLTTPRPEYRGLSFPSALTMSRLTRLTPAQKTPGGARQAPRGPRARRLPIHIPLPYIIPSARQNTGITTAYRPTHIYPEEPT